jgi:uncharacterized protein (TIGR03032 family)
MRLPQPFVRLPLTVDAAQLRREVESIPESAWRSHPEAAPGNTAVVLIGVAGDPDGDSTVGPMAPTPHLDVLPSVRQLLAALGTTVGRTRLMRIATETELGLHVDTNYYWWHHLRIHVPVQTTPDVVFEAGGESVHMSEGEVWVFDTWQRHRVDNPASSPRIHLVVDAVGSAPLWDLIDRPVREPRHLGAGGDTDTTGTGHELPIEQWNWPVVMAPAEVDATVESLLADLRAVDGAAAAHAEGLLGPFRHDWHDLTARYGPGSAGWPSRRALLDATRQRVRAELAGYQLVNGVALTHALDQLVFSPALTPGLAVGAPAAAAPARTSPGAAPRPSLLDGPPRIVDPVFIVCPPRSGSSLLFETLQRSPSLATIGGESHEVIEGIAALSPAAHDWDSNRLDASDATDGVVAHLKERFAARMRSRDGQPCRGPTRLLEKTPKNALRIPFLAHAFPDARFVFLYRDPRETVSSMLDAWRSEKFVTYRDLPGWDGPPWSLLLTPGWRDLADRPLGDIVSRQWADTVDALLHDLTALDGERWCVASYDQLVADPLAEIQRLCAFLDIDWDDDLAEPLPHSRHTLDSPHPDKWRRNADELAPFVDDVVAPAATRALDVFASAPRTEPVRIDDSADRRPVRRRATPPVAETGAAGSAEPSAPEGLTGSAKLSAPVEPTEQELFGSQHSGSFRALLQSIGASLLVTTYQAGRVVMVRDGGDSLNSHFRALPTPMGVAFNGRDLAIGTRSEIIVFQNQPALTARLDPPDRHDGCFVVRHRHSTGDIRVHDLAWGDEGLWIVNTRFSCLATLDAEHSFVPRWRPPFVTGLAAEDRCHLNGLAVIDGAPKYVTVLGTTDEAGGWRERKADGGAILDVPSGEIVSAGLSMPHSPRWHDGKLWVLESGRGKLAVVDPATGARDDVAEVPGFARGLTFVGRYALIGLSRVREHTFDGLPLTRDRTEPLQCGVWIVDTVTGEIAGHLAFTGFVQEIFEVALLHGLRYPELVEPGAPLGDTAFVLPDDALRDVAAPA